ncbi:hypothetical protein [Flavobacterium granuli]|nr:hypothetical protein [Flavobacterium granuli]
MKKQFTFYWFLLIGIASTNAQSPKSDFHKTVDNINAIIKANPLAYYISNKQYDGHITKINASEQGILSFTDSIPEPEITTEVPQKTMLISDCCPRKNSRTLDLFAIKKWDIHFPYADLKDKNNEIYGRFIGLKKTDLEKLREQFNKLTTLCKKNNN